MSRIVKKYSVMWNESQVSLKIPRGSHFLTAQLREDKHERVALYFSIPKDEKQTIKFNFHLVPDNGDIPENVKYIGTSQCHTGYSTVHLFKELP